MRREEQLQARLAELEQRLNQATPQEDTDSAAVDADAAVDEPDSSRLVSEQHRSSNRRGPFKAQPLTLEIVQHQVRWGAGNLERRRRSWRRWWCCWMAAAAACECAGVDQSPASNCDYCMEQH